jgi:hypothetical protein
MSLTCFDFTQRLPTYPLLIMHLPVFAYLLAACYLLLIIAAAAPSAPKIKQCCYPRPAMHRDTD